MVLLAVDKLNHPLKLYTKEKKMSKTFELLDAEFGSDYPHQHQQNSEMILKKEHSWDLSQMQLKISHGLMLKLNVLRLPNMPSLMKA